MNDAMNWVFNQPAATITWMVVMFLASTWLFMQLNHHSAEPRQRVSMRIRDTAVMVVFGLLLGALFSEGLEYINGDTDRSGIPALVRLTFWLPIIAGNWFDLLLYEMANHRGGWQGWIAEHPKAGALWLINQVKARAKNIRFPFVGVLLLVVTVLFVSCNFQPPIYTPSPPQMTAGALNSTYEAGTSTARAATVTPTATVTLISPAEATATQRAADLLSPMPFDTPTPIVRDTPTSSICPLPTLGPGTYVLEVTDCP